MKRQAKLIILLVVLLAVSAGAYFAVNLYVTGSEKKEAQKQAELRLIELSFDDVNKINYTTYDNDEYDMELDESGEWQLTNRDDIKLNQYFCSQIVSELYDLTALKNIGKPDSDKLSAYGLETPAKIEISDNQNTAVLYVGSSTSTNEAFYVQVEGKDDVYTIDYETGSLFYAGRNNLKDSYLLGGWSDSEITYMSIIVDGETMVEVEKGSNGWTMDNPVSHTVNSTEVAKLMSNLSRNEILYFTNEGVTEDDYAEYGYDNPYYKAVFKNDSGEKIEILAADKIESFSEGTTEVLYANSGQMAFIDNNTLSFMQAVPSDFTDMNLFDFTAADVEKIEMNLDSSYENCQFTLEYTYDTVNNVPDSLKYNGKKISLDDSALKQQLDETVNMILALKFEEVDLKAQSDREAEETIIFTKTDGSEVKYEFVPYGDDDNVFMIFKDGEYTSLTARRRAFSHEGGMVETCQELAEMLK